MRFRPPSLLRRLLAICLPPGPVREGLLGDLDELYAERRGGGRRLRADLWYAYQVVATLPHYLPARLGLVPGGRGAGPTGGFLGDLRLAARGIRLRPGHTLVAATTLAVGVGALTGMFSVVEQTILRPLPVQDQDRVVVAWNHHRVRGMAHYPFVGDVYRLVEDEAASLVAVAGAAWGHPTEVLLESPDGATGVHRQTRVLGDFFGVLGVEPVAGRTLQPADDLPGAAPVAVVSHALWERRWGGGPGVVGATLRAGALELRVVGVLPEGFAYPGGTEVWIPIRTGQSDWGGDGPFPVEVDLVARLGPGTTPAVVAEELTRIFADHPDIAAAYQDADPVVRPLEDVVLGDLRPTLLLLLGGAGLVLVVAFINVANLVRVRAAGRETAVAVRRALGAGRWRLAREALAEGLLLGGLGGFGGVALAWLSVPVVVSRAPPGLPRLEEVSSPGVSAHLFALAVTGSAVLLLTALPVARATGIEPAATLRGGTRSASGSGTRGRVMTVVGQTALAVWAVATAVLLLRSLVALQRLEPGFRADDVTLIELDHPHALFDVPPELPARMRSVSERVEALPWVEAVTTSFLRPMEPAGGVAILGRRGDQSMERAQAENPYLQVEVVGPGYFELLGLPVVRGRAFGAADGAGARPVVVVGESVARALWPDEDPLGMRLMGFQDTWWTVVGVTGDARYQSLTELLPTVYLPQSQSAIFPPRYLLVRTTGEGPVLPTVRRALGEIAPTVRVKSAASLRGLLEAPLARPRFSVLVLGVLGGAVLLLAAVGVYGVMMARVRARTAEMGVRIALGARPARVRSLVLRRGMAEAAGGAAVGGAAFVLGAGLVERLLFGVPATDPRSLAAGAALVLAAAALACWLPAHRAANLDPARTLRSE